MMMLDNLSPLWRTIDLGLLWFSVILLVAATSGAGVRMRFAWERVAFLATELFRRHPSQNA
jgi:hypothetical protein